MRRVIVVVLLVGLVACSGESRPSGTHGKVGEPVKTKSESGDTTKPERQPETEPETEPEIKPEPEPAPLDRSCKTDAECVPAPGCCPAPCSSTVINVAALDEAKSRLSCPTSLECPAAGACRTHAYLCVEGSCTIAFEGDPGYRVRE